MAFLLVFFGVAVVSGFLSFYGVAKADRGSSTWKFASVAGIAFAMLTVGVGGILYAIEAHFGRRMGYSDTSSSDSE